MTNTFDTLVDSEIHCIDNVYRFNKQPVIRNETVSQHQFWVVLFAITLFDEVFHYEYEGKVSIEVMELNNKVMRFAALHDILEAITGDVNHDLKYNPFNGKDVKKVLNAYEDELKNQFGKTPHRRAIAKSLRPHDAFVETFVKVCDWLALIKNIQQEVGLGNNMMQNIILNTKTKTIAALGTLEFCVRTLNHELPVSNLKKRLVADVDVPQRLIGEIKLMKI